MSNSGQSVRISRVDVWKKARTTGSLCPLLSTRTIQLGSQLNLLEKQRISKEACAVLHFRRSGLFCRFASGKPVGRITAHVNRRHLERHRDNTGHFGFFRIAQTTGKPRALWSKRRRIG